MFLTSLLLLLITPKLQVTTEAEAAQMRAEVTALVAASRAKRCPRPSLWGAPQIEGDSGAAILNIIEGPEAGACLRQAREIKAMSALDPTLRARVEARCVALPRLIHEATRYAEGCSPYLLGRRKLGRLAKHVVLSKAARVMAEAEARAGRTEAAMTLLLEQIQINQDLMRGGAPLLLPMLATAGDALLLDALEPLLTNEAPKRVGEALGVLLAHDPHFSESLQADGLHVFYEDILPSGSGASLGLSLGADIPDDITLVWLAMKEMRQAYARACEATRSLEDCVAGLKALEARPGEVKPAGWRMWLKLATGGKEAVKRQAIELLKAITSPGLSRYVERFSARVARLEALRARLTTP
ncbi:hypothetical protein KKF91_19500 [Myxococcota bacterium]|nr:hypothetical protein [Myxococcota bacterium]MBU1432732.1 hypothetical protein [Myxococcota bacterium]